jgi:hypothetical protein
VLSLASRHAKRALTKGELCPVFDLDYHEIAEEESEVMTCELVKSQTARKN